MNSTLPLIPLANGQPGLRASLRLLDTTPLDEDLLWIRVSDESLDRYGEIISASGWKLANYRRNPVVQNCHQYGDVTFTIARAIETRVENNQLHQIWEFASRANPLAKIARDLYRGGFLRAASVGFIPLRWENGDEQQGFRRRYLEQELVEVSAVAIPANPGALALGLEAGAVDTRALQELAAMLRRIPALQPDFCTQPAGPAANARASGRATHEALWLQLLREIHEAIPRH